MTKKLMHYTGAHMPQGVYEIDEGKVDELLKQGGWTIDGSSKPDEENIVLDYKHELINLPKIDKKTAKDIMNVFGSREGLKKAIKNHSELPFEDDVVTVLTEHYRGG